jgi:hypothetical protein
MRVEFLGLITMLLGAALLLAPVRHSFSLMMVTTAFGAAAAISLTAVGGASILLANLFLLFFLARIFRPSSCRVPVSFFFCSRFSDWRRHFSCRACLPA